ncbi:hypothetical protein V7112_08730 [Bacillus sp. JJ1566]|uniref:hypothetical protein n=1 Tax=Bacillus sp. JJ1566 TaxID=3122961 RepID=UPI002FFD9D36
MKVETKVPELIHDICPSCHPTAYVKTKAKFTGDIEDCGTHKEYLYKCTSCDARLWVDEQWARTHEVKEKQ